MLNCWFFPEPLEPLCLKEVFPLSNMTGMEKVQDDFVLTVGPFRRPTNIENVDTSAYDGRVGDVIRITPAPASKVDRFPTVEHGRMEGTCHGRIGHQQVLIFQPEKAARRARKSAQIGCPQEMRANSARVSKFKPPR